MMDVRNLQTKKVVVYGGAYVGRYTTALLQKIGVLISEVTESNSELWNTEFMNGLYIKPNIDVLCQISSAKKDYFIITAFFNDDLFQQSLIRNGFVSASWKEIVDLFVEVNETEVYDIDYDTKFKIWFMGLRDELDFWETAYAKIDARKHDLYLQLADTVNFHEKYLSRSVKENDIVMDIGSGILSRYGSALNTDKKIILLPVDPLACWYNFFNEKYLDIDKISQKEKILFGIFERLSHTYHPNSADVIIISNALDHCIDPFRSILESLKVLKTGGTLLLKHLRREAINEKEVGLHQWNMDVSKNKEFIIWNRENYLNVSKILKDYVKIKISFYAQDERGYKGNFGFFVVEITKIKEIAEELMEKYEKKNIPLFIENLEKIFCEIMKKDYKKLDIWTEMFQALEERNG